MVSIRTFTQVHQRLTEIFDTANTDKLFGGISIITVGDFLQLKPVMGKFIFASPKKEMLTHIWKDIFSMIELTQNHRQANDQSYAAMLNRFRLALQTQEDLQTLKQRQIPQHVLSKPPFNQAIHIYPTNDQCHHYNKEKINQLEDIVHLHAAYEIIRNSNPPKSLNALLPTDDRDCAALPTTLSVAPKAQSNAHKKY
jgi:hypothetical protein